MKVCMVGNSHLAAIKMALDDGALDGMGIDLEFFGAPGRSFKKLRFDNGTIGGPSDIVHELLLVSGNKRSRLDPTEFDAVIIYGGSLYLKELTKSILVTKRRRGNYLSDQFIREGIADWLESTLAFQLAKKTSETGVRTLLLPRPIPAPRQSSKATRHPEARAHDIRSVFLRVQEISHSKGVEFILQPFETLTLDLRHTRSEYSVDSKRLLDTNATHGEEDVNHMNARFGRVVLARLSEVLQTRPEEEAISASSQPASSKGLDVV